MTALRDMIQHDPGLWLAVGGLLIGIAFGTLVFRTNFCTMGSISDLMSFGDYRRFRAWLLAAATAIAGTQVLDLTGTIVLSKSMYQSPTLNWFGHIAGGLMFGYGMIFAGGCASRNLVRVGSGDLRSLLTLTIMSVFAYMSIGGILGPARSWIEQATSIDLAAWQLTTQSIGEILGAATHLGVRLGSMIVAMLCVGVIGAYCLANEDFRTSPVHIASGIGIGLCVVAGWALTGLAFDEMADRPANPTSLTFVRPTADALEWLQRFTAVRMPGFGVATVIGVIFGSFIAAVLTRRFKFSTFSGVSDTRRSLFGAALMGLGGVMALGCTVGQAITGVSTLALGSFLTFPAIVAGGILGMKRLEQSLTDEA